MKNPYLTKKQLDEYIFNIILKTITVLAFSFALGITASIIYDIGKSKGRDEQYNESKIEFNKELKEEKRMTELYYKAYTGCMGF